VNGRRVKTVDTHSHCFIPEALALLDEDTQHAVSTFPAMGTPDLIVDIPKRLRSMDAMAIDQEVLSVPNPFWYELDHDRSARIVQIQNEGLAALCQAQPDRFAAFATLSMQFPDLAVRELEYAVSRLGLRGVATGDRVGKVELSDRRFDPVWARLEELGAVLYIHGQYTPELSTRLAGNGWLNNVVGIPLGAAIALQHLIFEGVFDRFPRLKVLAAHGGGYLPSYAARSDHSCRVAPALCKPEIPLRKAPSEYLNQIYFDSLVFTPEGLRHLVAQVGAGQIVLGTDHPIPWEEHPVELVFNTAELSDSARIGILGDNARRLLRLT
jgi:aminocarboxymuconate-semialdehyde decarboxylase